MEEKLEKELADLKASIIAEKKRRKTS